MFQLTKLLVATDFSNRAERALRYAIELARPFNAEIVLVHVYQIPVYGFPDGTIVPSAATASQLADAAQGLLDRCLERCSGAGVRITGYLREGVPREQIIETAKELGVDMIIVATHGRRGITRALLGSVAENVIRTAEVPVLAVREPIEPEHGA